jgi:hypothetical protein
LEGSEVMSCIEFTEKYTEEQIAALEKMHTKQLLNKKNNLYINSEYCSDCGSWRDPECDECYRNTKYNKEQLKKILSAREHIPNKTESKELRKARIKKGR